ncbi:energy-coupling factor ABC transporter ATP-binding protein [Agromyces seonyuensis]|uniref:ATP-binding cassette domain-containing protein n=1 Tax=Agromyces seonyuensis TaxID=2662446 RepID=A0A6I4NVH6_9MICO|nr:ABC transporter ATP-binding protein [Agromyces seonyuensis]MWB98253.1 ATP-binding cassette domain-containing protein [Agromyces seonyuensis]
MARLRFEGVGVRFGDARVLDGIDLDLTERRIGVVGANGSGKSTLARLINGLVSPTSGRLLVDDLDVAREGRAVRRRVGFVFTNPDSQIVMPTVREDVAFTLRPRKLPKAETSARVDAVLDRLGIAHLADRPAHHLSGGQKQLLALAAVLVGEPDVLVADEPTTLLDARNAREIAARFAELPQQVLLVTHQLGLVADFDRVLVVDAGRIVADDEPGPALAFYERLLDAEDAASGGRP